MKFSFMSFSTPQMTLGEMLQTAKRLGYAGIEPRVESRHRHGVELTAGAAERQAMREQWRRSGIVMCCIATSCKYANPAEASRNVEDSHRYIDLAADLDVRRLRVFGGQWPDSVTPEQAADSLVTSLKSVADHAAEKDVTFCVETHDAWCDPKQVADAMRRIDHPAIGVNWDVMHTRRKGGADMDAAYGLLRPWIHHLHLHDGVDEDGKLRFVPIGTGAYDHRHVLELLKQDGYEGFLSGEWMEKTAGAEFFSHHLDTEIATLQRYERELA